MTNKRGQMVHTMSHNDKDKLFTQRVTMTNKHGQMLHTTSNND